MGGSLAAARLPQRALRLVGRNWGPLLVWFCAGYLVHDLVLRAAAEVGRVSRVAGLVLLSAGVLVHLVIIVAMFQVIRADLPALSGHLRAEGAGQGRIPAAIARGVLPFVILYGAWGLYVDDVRTYGNLGLRQGDLGLLTDVGLAGPLGVVAATLLLRGLAERLHRRSGRPALGVFVAFLETNWMFFAIVTVLQLAAQAVSWVTSRVFWVELVSVYDAVASWLAAVLAGLGLSALIAVWRLFTEYVPQLKDGFVLPLLWLTIAAVVYGRDMLRTRELVSGHRRLERVGGAVERLPGFARTQVDLLSRGVREKYVPLFNALRLVLRAGPGVYLTFCVLFVGIEHASSWAWIAATRSIGAHDAAFWDVALVPLTFVTDTAGELLRVALLAATFDLVLRRVSGRVAGLASTADRSAPPAGPPVATPRA